MPRELSESFLEDLTTGLLSPFYARVRRDSSLDLQIRDEYVNLYYRGCNLLRISKGRAGYVAFFDPQYLSGAGLTSSNLPDSSLSEPSRVQDWLEVLPELKLSIDLFGPPEEREAQQQIVRANNYGREARWSDFFICDIEYANDHGRFDLVGVHWPSTSAVRKNEKDRRLVFIEAKHGNSAISGHAGILQHISDIESFAADGAQLAAFKSEMCGVFNQKRALNLIDCGRDLTAFDDQKPIVLLALVDHDPEKSALRSALRELPPLKHVELQVASSSFMGHALFDPFMLSAERVLESIEKGR